MSDPYNVRTFAIKRSMRKGKKRVLLLGDCGDGKLTKRYCMIPVSRMRDVKSYLAEFEGTLLVDFDAPVELLDVDEFIRNLTSLLK